MFNSVFSNERREELAGVTAVILAGGKGTRLQSIVSDRPKALAPVGSRPFLEYLLRQLAHAGFQQVVLCTGYLGERIRATFGSTYQGLCLAYSQEPSPLGTGGALKLALPLMASESVLVMNGDSYCEADLAALWAHHTRRKANATLLLTEIEDGSRYGHVTVGADGQVLSFQEKAEAGRHGSISAGVYCLRRTLVEGIPSGAAASLERDVFPAWVGRGLNGYCSKGRFLDIGTPESYAAAEQFFLVNTP